MNEDEEEINTTNWRCTYCAYKNDETDSRCLICSKAPTTKSAIDHYPIFVSKDDDTRFFTTDTGNAEEEELENADKADRDNLIIKIAGEENLSLAQAEVAVDLMEINYDRESAVEAALQCSTFEAAKVFLSRRCLICECLHPASKMEPMVFCEHSCCILCAKQYFTIQVREKSLLDIVCPVCSQPVIGETVMFQEYFSMVDSQLKRILDVDVYELLQIKLRDYSLSNDPEFFWCKNCKDSFGFCTAGYQSNVFTCPRCRNSYCAKCFDKWDIDHDCYSLNKSKKADYKNDLDRFLNHSSIQCPRCETKYNLVRGGCIHFTCTQCKYNWCAGCQQQFLQGKSCKFSKKCVKLGLHAHHPRNCFYYGRDRDFKTLQQLLTNHRIPFEINPLDGPNGLCPVLENNLSTVKDSLCGKSVEDGQAGLCTNHYREYLSTIIFKSGIDPVDIMDAHHLTAELQRNGIREPAKKKNETDQVYYQRLKQMVVDKLPLPSSKVI